MNEWRQLWAVEWHVKGALFVRRLGDSVALALARRKEGKEVGEAIVGVAPTLDAARDLERQIKRGRKDHEGHNGTTANQPGGRADGPTAGTAADAGDQGARPAL
ncbi:MAG: hypothetical protein PHX05_07680 [Acidobacteriota bacterium]|jgi:hypothetical protein|nr:hypothetical protein [Acidobacteriota bacterium]